MGAFGLDEDERLFDAPGRIDGDEVGFLRAHRHRGCQRHQQERNSQPDTAHHTRSHYAEPFGCWLRVTMSAGYREANQSTFLPTATVLAAARDLFKDGPQPSVRRPEARFTCCWP